MRFLFGTEGNLLPIAQTRSATGAGTTMAIRNYTLIGGLPKLEQCGASDASDSSVTRRSSKGFTTTPIAELTSKDVANRLGWESAAGRLGKDRQFLYRT